MLVTAFAALLPADRAERQGDGDVLRLPPQALSAAGRTTPRCLASQARAPQRTKTSPGPTLSIIGGLTTKLAAALLAKLRLHNADFTPRTPRQKHRYIPQTGQGEEPCSR
jgi:hypothetical protein